MIFKRTATNRGFTLVELLLVIVLIAVLMAVVKLSGFGMMESTNAQTEARRIIRTVHALRSAWLSHYADTQKMIGLPEGTWTQSNIDSALSQYSDRNLEDERNRYGEIMVKNIPTGSRSTYIGFTPSASHPGELSSKYAAARNMIMDSLEAQAIDYELDVSRATNEVYIRIK